DAPDPVLANLEAHGVRMQTLGTAREIRAETFRVDSTGVAEREVQGHRERVVHGVWQPATAAVPSTAIVIPMDQPLARLIFTLLEPRSDDGLVNWNFFDATIDADRSIPIVRVREPLPISP